MLSVAKWYKESPSSVEQWPITKYHDRLEYMLVVTEMQNADEDTGKTEWLGPDTDG